MPTRLLLFFVAVCPLLATEGIAQPLFTRVHSELFPVDFQAYNMAVGDFNNDGWPDVFISDPESTLLYNTGRGSFADQIGTIEAALPSDIPGGTASADYDNDGDMDLFVEVIRNLEQAPRNLLLRNDEGRFVEVGAAAGLGESLATRAAIWFDYDRDGHLDLYTGNAGLGLQSNVLNLRNALYKNSGDGTFIDVTAAVGLDLALQPTFEGTHSGMVAGDFNDDGWPDLYVSVLAAPDRLFLNDGQGGFLDTPQDEFGHEAIAMGVAVGDIDNDGDLDIFQGYAERIGGIASEALAARSLLLLNRGNAQFLDFTESAGLAPITAAEIPAPQMGDLDLLLAAAPSPSGSRPEDKIVPHYLFLNNGDTGSKWNW